MSKSKTVEEIAEHYAHDCRNEVEDDVLRHKDTILAAIREGMKLCEPYMEHVNCPAGRMSPIGVPWECVCGLDQLKEMMK